MKITFFQKLFPTIIGLLAVRLVPVDAAHDDHDQGEGGGDEGVAVGGELLPPVLLSQPLSLHGHLVSSSDDGERGTTLLCVVIVEYASATTKPQVSQVAEAGALCNLPSSEPLMM